MQALFQTKTEKIYNKKYFTRMSISYNTMTFVMLK